MPLWHFCAYRMLKPQGQDCLPHVREHVSHSLLTLVRLQSALRDALDVLSARAVDDRAGAKIPEEMTGHSLLPILKNQSAGRSDFQRDFVDFGRERHVPAQRKPSMQGYPARAIRTDRWMLKLNLEPELWPAGAPSGATHLSRNFAECDRRTDQIRPHGNEG